MVFRGGILLLSLLGTAEVFAGCHNPAWEKHDTRSAEDFLENRELIEKWKKKASLPPPPTPKPIQIKEGLWIISSEEPGFELPDFDLAVKEAMGFSEGLGAVIVDGKFGFIDTKGKIVIEPRFTSANCFSEALSAVEIDGKWGFIDKTGTIVIPIKYDFALSFSEGLALVKVGKLWGYVDGTGKFAIEPKYEEARSFSEGLANIRFYDKDHIWMSNVERKGRWRSAFIDKSGNMALGPLDGAYGDFTGGMAMVDRIIGYRDGVIVESYFIDKSGKELWVYPSAEINRFADDVIVIEVERKPGIYTNRYSFLNRRGKKPTEKRFDNISAFSEGLAVAKREGRSGFINKSGEFVIETVFDRAHNFSEGLAAVYKDEKIGFLDKKGEWRIEPRFSWTGYFHEGRAAVAIGNKFGYVGKIGKYIWKPSR